MRRSIGGALLGALTILWTGLSHAAEEKPNLRLVVRDVGATSMPPPNDNGAGLLAIHSVVGGAFKDGRLGYKEFVRIGFDRESVTQGLSSSSYVFENSDALNVRFAWAPKGSDHVVTYDVLSGSDAYGGATGTGKLLLVPAKWSDATLFKGSIDVTTL